MKLFSKKLSWIYIAAVLTACGGGGEEGPSDAEGGAEPTQPPVDDITVVDPGNLNAKQQVYFDTLFPILRQNCSGCHSERNVQTTANINTPKFADRNIPDAYEVLVNMGNFVIPDDIANSRVVTRLREDQHGCWPNALSCAANVATITEALNDWYARDPESPGVVPPPPPAAPVDLPDADSEEIQLEAFKNSVFDVTSGTSCGACHGDNAALPQLAHSDPSVALQVVADRVLIDFDSPSESALVKKMELGHNCGGQCETLATDYEQAVTEWIELVDNYNRNGIGGGPAPNNAPSAVADDFQTVEGVQLTTGSVLANDVDVDTDDILTVTDWDTLSTQGGTVAYNGNATFTYTPAAGFVGDDQFNYTIADDAGEESVATVTVSVIASQGVIAFDDKVFANANRTTVIDTLMDNDEFSTGTATAITIVEPRSDQGGTVVLNDDNTVSYTPPQGFTGEDRFDYSISDGAASASAEVTVSINASPIAVDDGDYTYTGEEKVILHLLDNDFDINGDELTITDIDDNGVDVVLNADGSITYDPANGVQSETFQYTVSDGRGGSSTAEVTINIVDPIISDDVNPIDNLAVFDDIDDDNFLQALNETSPAMLAERDGVVGNFPSAQAYYAAVDPTSDRTTRRDFYETNGMINGNNVSVDEEVVYQNANDLGFIRLFRIRLDPETDILSSCVQNYQTFEIGLAAQAAGALGNFDAIDGVADETDGLLATVCMETKPKPGENPNDPNAEYYTVFYGYGPDDARFDDVSLDGRLSKAVPGVCNACHGGRPKTPINGEYPDGGDTTVRNIPWYVDTFAFEDVVDDPADLIEGVNAVDKGKTEEILKRFNQIMFDYEHDVTPGAKEVLEGSYGVRNGELFANEFNEFFVPEGWAGHNSLYREVVSPYCRACHLQLGNEANDAIAFRTYDDFMSFRDRIDHLVFNESTMPLARLTFQRFWDDPVAAEILAREINSDKSLDGGDLVISPGRVIANAGPSREAAVGVPVILDGGGSLLFNRAGQDNAQGAPDDVTFTWELQTPPDSQAVLDNPNGAVAEFDPDVPGLYRARLVVDDGDINTPDSPPAEVVIVVREDIDPVSFVRDIIPIMQVCGDCHVRFNAPRFDTPEILHEEVLEYVDTQDIENSLILLKPSSEKTHGGNVVAGFETKTSPNYVKVLRWIAEGANEF